MSSTSLIALTPRAGKSNHRYIVPPDCSFTEIELSDMLRLTKSNTHRDDYVYASNKVQQTSGGRTGIEVLVLTNVGKTSRWSDLEKRSIQNALEQKLQQFAQLVEQTDWDGLPTEAITRRPEMTQWQSEMQTLLSGFNHPETGNKTGNKIGIIASLILAACLLTVGFYVWNQGETKTLPSGGGQNEPGKGDPEQGTGSDRGQAPWHPIETEPKPDPIVSTLSISSDSRITLEKFISQDNNSEERRQAIRDICKAASELAALSEEKPESGIKRIDYELSLLWKLIHEKVPHGYVPSSGPLDDNEGKVLYNLVGVVFGDDATRRLFESVHATPIDALKDYVSRKRDFLVAEEKNENRPSTIRKTAKLLLDIADLLNDVIRG